VTRPQSYLIRTFGCQMNAYDSERMAELLESRGLEPAEDERADVVVLNTCHIREKAAEKLYSEVGRIGAAGRERAEPGEAAAKPLIVVAGCVAQAEGDEIMRRAPAVDAVVGPQSYHRLPEILEGARRRERPVDTDMPVRSKFTALPGRGRNTQRPLVRRSPSAFLTVQEGCDKFCTFCVVPYTRGAEASRPAAEIIAEAGALVGQGAREVTLLGQNVNAYRGRWDEASETDGTIGLPGLIRRLALIPGLARIRYTTSHPRDMDDGLIAAHAEVQQLMPYLHLPVQAGSDRVLKRMNRAHTASSYLGTVERLRRACPDIALSGDFIVGFPGETREDFEATLALVREVGYAQAYSFKYSPRPGTPAACMEDQVPEPEKSERLAELQALLSEQQHRFNRGFEGCEMDVLLEREGRHAGQVLGRSPWMQSVHLSGAGLAIGDLVRVRITSAGPHGLTGESIEREAA
jgi:tRNA-2-methylthio-N6-dimethylallyladenosine synthase